LALLRNLADQTPVIRSADLKEHGIHRQTLRRAVGRGIVRKIDRGLYVALELLLDLKHRVILACRRVPHGIVCLGSALCFHGIISTESDVIWMAIDRKARKPAQTGLNLRFVRFSGQALTQGVTNIRIDGEPVSHI
jgi:predicted transcriptional regulator of viral defense system